MSNCPRQIAITLSILFIVLAPVPALGCLCTGLPKTEAEVAEWFSEADLVAIASVQELSVRSWVNGAFDDSEGYAEVAVIAGFKGAEIGERIQVYLSQKTTCRAPLKLRDTYLFFAYAFSSDGRLRANKCNIFLYATARPEDLEYDEEAKAQLETVVKALRELY